MKTIQKGMEIKRVSDEKADLKVKNEGWSFIPKKDWKESVRNMNAAIAQEKVDKPVKKEKKPKK